MRNINENDFLGMEHLLPDSIKELILVIGFDSTFLLIKHYPGTYFPIGKNVTKNGRVLHAALAEVVGEDNAEKVEVAFQAQRKLFIPKCDGVIQELRNRKIRKDFDQLTKAMTATMAVDNLAIDNDLAVRWVWKILKEVDSEPVKNANQITLF